MSKFIFLVDGEMLSESLHFTTGLLSSLGAQIVLSSEELLNEAVIEVYSTAQKVEGVNVVSALRRIYTGSITSRLPDFLSLKLSSLPQHPNTSQRLALCLKTLVNASAPGSCIFILATTFEPLPQTLPLIESAAVKSIHLQFIAIHPTSQPIAPLPPPTLSLSWKTDAGAALPLDPKAASFLALTSNTLNAKVMVVLSDELSRERLAMTLAQKILGLSSSSFSLTRVTLSYPGNQLPPLELLLSSQIKRISVPFVNSHRDPHSEHNRHHGITAGQLPSALDQTAQVQIGASCHLAIPHSSLEALDKHQGDLKSKSKEGMELIIHSLVSRSTVNESLLYGWPQVLLPDDLSFDMDDDPEGGSRNRRGVQALCRVAHEGQALVLASSCWDTDLRRRTLGKIWYILTPSSSPPPDRRNNSGEINSQCQEVGPGQAGAGAALMMRKVACRSMLLPLQASSEDDLTLPSQEEIDKTREVLSVVQSFDPLDLDDGSEGLVINLGRLSSSKKPSHPVPLPPQALPPTGPLAPEPAVESFISSDARGEGRSGGKARLQLEPVGKKKETRKKG